MSSPSSVTPGIAIEEMRNTPMKKEYSEITGGGYLAVPDESGAATMKLSCSAYQAGSSYAQKILHGHTQNYGATSTSTNLSGDSTQGLTMPSWQVEEVEGKCSPNETPPEFGNETLEGGGGYQAGGTPSSSSTVATAAAGNSRGAGAGASGTPRRASSSSHLSDGQGDRHSDSTTASKTQATSSGSPTDSPGRLSELSRSRSKSVGEQQWTNLRAVLAWYARLRRIKRSKSNQRWMKLRTTVQLTGAIQTIQKKAPLKREDSFLKRFSTRQVPEAQDTFEVADEDGTVGVNGERTKITRKRKRSLPRTVVNPDGNFYFYWLMILTFCVLYNLWTLIVRQSFPELQSEAQVFWILTDSFSDLVYLLDIAVQFRTGYLEQGLMVYKTKKLAKHYIGSKPFYFDLSSLIPTDLFQLYYGTHPMFRFPRFLKIYRTYNYYYMVESRTVYPNVWRVVNLIHILLLLAHWFGCFYFLLSEAEHFEGPWVYPNPTNPNNTDFAPLTRKYLGSLYWSTLTLTTIGDLPTPYSNWQYLFTIISYLIGVFIFATIVGQVGNVITNRNANRLEFERLLDGAKMYMRHHKVPRDMQRRVLRWYDYSWSRGRIQGGGDINTALGLLPDKLKTELALHVNLSVLKKVTIFQECQPEFLHDLVLKMKAYIFTPGDLICRKGEVAREMFIIADGILEVISETGKVLTTMQAGDFFGEIGILNLDGLNKRTADVRSVGYSELFSLSREDVLAAMKDYPEAQDILQTLGRKRLMEARKANTGAAPKKPSAAEVAKKAAQALSLVVKEAPDGGDQLGDGATGKSIVEKLQSDFKGLKDVIRRSRKSNSSKDDSSEPESGRLDGELGGRDAKSFPPPRGVLKRMHNVLSDEKEKEKEPSTSTSTSTSSPSILSKRGMGGKRVQLPLAKSPPSPEKVHEVIGEGLPLFQRLRLLKQKEERERKQQEEREAMMQTLVPSRKPQSPPSNTVVAPITTATITVPKVKSFKSILAQSGIVKTKAAVEIRPPSASTPDTTDLVISEGSGAAAGDKRDSISSIDSGSVFSSPPVSLAHRALSPPPKPASLLIGEAAAIAASKATTEPISITAPPMPPKLSSQISFSPPVTSGNMSPPVLEQVSVGRDRSASASSSYASTSTEPNPFSFVRPAALQFRQKTYGSVDDLSPEFSRLPFVKKLKILNERQKIAVLLMSKTSSNVLTRSTSEGSNETTTVAGSESIERTEAEQLYSLALGRRTQSNQEQLQGQGSETDQHPNLPSSSSFGLTGKLLRKYNQSPPEREVRIEKPLGEKQDRAIAMEQRAEPFGVHYSGHTQSTSATNTVDDSNATKCLTKYKLEVNEGTGSRNSSKIPSRLSQSPTHSHGKKRKNTKKTTQMTDKGGEEATTSSSSSSTPSPPEMDSTETPERRNLKSILKRLAKSEETAESDSKRARESGPGSMTRKLDERKLLKAPTIEGYAARHRKFAKNVTFHRQAVTVVSPEDLAAIGARTEKGALRISEAYQVVRPEAIPYEPITDAEIVPVSDDPFNDDYMKSFRNLMVMKGEDLQFAGDRHPATLQIGLNIAQEECIGSVFMGIKSILQSKVDEIHSRFQDNFNTLEHEVRKRDEIIFRLQRHIQELERGPDRRRTRNGNGMRENFHSMDFGGNEGDNEMDDIDGDIDNEEEILLDAEAATQRRYPLEFQTSYLFSRGDSIDTVISAQDYEDEVFERSEVESRLAAQSLSQPMAEPRSSSHYNQQQHRHSRDMGNGDGQQKHSTANWSQRSEVEKVGMGEFGTAPWQVEFHRDRDSLPPPNERRQGTRNLDKDSVAVEIGNTSTEYESSGSSGSEEPKCPKQQSGAHDVLHRRLKEEPVALDDDDDDEEGDQTDVGSEEEESEESSADEPELTNKNWEVQLLAKEMERIEQKPRRENLEMLGEAEHLQNEIKQMRDAVTSGELSPSELDMLETILETKSRRVKAIVKALSVEEAQHPASGAARVTTSTAVAKEGSKKKSKSSIGRSVDDLHGATSGSSSSMIRPMRSNQFQTLTASELPISPAYLHPRLSLGILPSISPSITSKPSTSTGMTEKLSPGEKRELHKLVFSRKRSTTVRRQASLCETSLTATTTTSVQSEIERRRESAGAFPVASATQGSSTKSFFSKFSLVRQFTSRGSGNQNPGYELGLTSVTGPEPSTSRHLASSANAEFVTVTGRGDINMQPVSFSPSIMTTVRGTPNRITDGSEQHLQPPSSRTSSAGAPPNISTTNASVLPSSVKSDHGSMQGKGPMTTAQSVVVGTGPLAFSASTTATAASDIVTSSFPAMTISSAQPCSSKSLMTGKASATTSDLGVESQSLLKK